MNIYKRNGELQVFDSFKIAQAIEKACANTGETINGDVLNHICEYIEEKLMVKDEDSSVEHIQDMVEEQLMKNQLFKVAKAYILYREKRSKLRIVIERFDEVIEDRGLHLLLKKIAHDFDDELYSLNLLLQKLKTFVKDNMNEDDKLSMLIKASVELISKEAPKWEFIAARFLNFQINLRIEELMCQYDIQSFSAKIAYLDREGYYGAYIREAYSDQEINELGSYLNEDRNELFTFSGLDLVAKRYLIHSHDHRVLETPQEMFMGISMHLAMKEIDKMDWAKKFYDMLSTLKVTMATPTMSNARKPYHQLSSCFIDTVGDSLNGIYKSLDNFAQVSKHGGGMGMYFGKVRANGSDIRGYQGAAGGIIRWLKLVNDTATAVDQLGMRQGAVAVYLDAWHRDLPEFLSLRTNNGDDRMKAHDIFPAICYPDLFWKKVKEDINGNWYLMCPHEILVAKGYALEDYYGDEWEKRYIECVNDPHIQKRIMSIKEIVRLIIKSAVETGTPFAFNRDHVNKMNPNSHRGIIYCSNLCTEIAQNMSVLETLEKEIIEVNNESIVVERYKSGDFVVCNLASLILGNINVNDPKEVEHLVKTSLRALDNVIDLNYYPLPYAKITNQRYRAVGLGVSGYHHMLVKQGLRFESQEHLDFVDKLFEDIAYYAISSSNELAKEKGSYSYFEGSDWQSGAYLDKRHYEGERWDKLRVEMKYGMRNAYLMATAPTSSTSIIAGTSASVDPIMNKYFLEEKKGSMIVRVAPDLNMDTFWLYKSAHLIDQSWVIKAGGIRQRHIDQAQSLNLYITNEFTFRQVLNLYIQAWEEGVKTIYYVRSKALEVDECESCAS